MVNMLKGQTIILYETVDDGFDEFRAPIKTEKRVEVENVLIEPVSNDAIIAELQISGKRVVYTLHIPKNDAHNWTDAKVELPNIGTFKTFGDCLVYDENLTPLQWNKKVKVEKYE